MSRLAKRGDSCYARRMKIAVNVSRDRFGGITTSNSMLFDALDAGRDAVVGVELTSRRAFPGATLFWKYQPHFFHHHVVNCFDLMQPKLVRRGDSLASFAKRWKPAVDAVVDILRREAPDVVLVNGTFFVPWVLARAARKLKLPIVLRYAGVLRRETSHFSPAVQRTFREMERDIVRASRRIVFPSDLCRRVVEQEVSTDLPEWSVVYNPVHPTRGSRPPESGSHDIATIGRWVPIKNFGAFFDLHAALKKEKWPHRAFLVTTHGRSKGIPRTVTRIPPMDHEQLWRFYDTLGLLVMPSHFETFGNVAAEALARGVPVLVSRNTGFAEVLDAVGLGEMAIDFDDVAKVAERAKALCGKRVPPSKLSALRKMLDPNVSRDRIMAVLREIAEEKSA